jgi:hypothetical protein
MSTAAPAERATSPLQMSHRAAAGPLLTARLIRRRAGRRGRVPAALGGAELAQAKLRPSQVPVRPRLDTGRALDPGPVLLVQRKCACGGADTSCQCEQKGFQIQTKVKVGPANDPFEQEADQVAETVMRLPTDEPAAATVADVREDGKQRII